MSARNYMPEQDSITLVFKDKDLEKSFRRSYDKSVKLPLRYGIIISILSWFSAIFLIPAIIPEETSWLAPLTFVYIGSYFGFIVYATYRKRFRGYYHLIGAISNAWAGLYAVFFCDQFPNGEHLTLPVLIFIIFFGSYMVRLRWIAGFIAAFTYTLAYHIYIAAYSDLTSSQVILYAFVGWMNLIFAILAGRVAERNNRIAFIQAKTIREQSAIIEKEKEILLKEVHHRVKNNLQIIISLINLQLSKFDSKEVEVALREAQNRVMSMSLVHQRINQTSNFNAISLRGYSQQLIDHVRQYHDNTNVTFELDISEKATVDIETAIPIGLIINEIVTNFFKHCVPNTGHSILTFETIREGKQYTLIFRDNGPGLPDGIVIEDSFGLELIQSLADQVDGTVEFYNDNGAVCKVWFEQPDF